MDIRVACCSVHECGSAVYPSVTCMRGADGLDWCMCRAWSGVMFSNQPFVQSHPYVWERDMDGSGDPSSDREYAPMEFGVLTVDSRLVDLRCNKTAD